MTKTNALHPLLVVFAVALSLCACGERKELIKEAHSASATATPMDGRARIIFVRAMSSDATSVDYRRSPVFRLKDNDSDPELVGILSVKTMVAYQADPGKHMFMVVGENADFMTADVLPNMTYYVLIAARVGNRAALYTFKPLSKQEQVSKNFKELIASSKWVENTSVSLNWAASNLATIKKTQTDYYRLWTNKPESERSRLLPNDGVGGS